MVLRLQLDQESFSRYDYGRAINFRIYKETVPFLYTNTAFDASSYTGAVAKVFKRHGDRFGFFRDVAKAIFLRGELSQIISDITVSWDTQASGIGHFAFTSTLRNTVPGTIWIAIQLTKSGEQTSTELVKCNVQPMEAS